MSDPLRHQIITDITWHEALNAVCVLAGSMSGDNFAEYDAKKLEKAARNIRGKLSSPSKEPTPEMMVSLGIISLTHRQMDDLLAKKAMGWELWNGDWYSPWIEGDNRRKFRAYRLWMPTNCAVDAVELWKVCLSRARDMGYELTQEIDKEGRFRINGHHPTAKRLLKIDKNFEMLICRFAFELFDIHE